MNKISDKAVWDELTPSEDENISPAPFSQPTQPQMTFCYNCNQVIPANSVFCPWCQIELFVICPKCGNKYSSQYPACNQCGTNRTEYLLVVKKKEEAAKKRKEREDKKRAERQKKEAEFKKTIEESRKAREISKRQREAAQTQVSVKHKNSQLAQNKKLTFGDILPLIVWGLFLFSIICFIMDFFV